MKVAICFMGLSDSRNHNGHKISFNESYTYLKNHLKNHDFDIYFHTWESNDQNHEIQKTNLLSILKPKSYLIQKPMFTNLPSIQFRIKSRWFSQQKVIQLYESYSKENNIEYDYVLISRFDCSFFNFFEFKDVKKNILYLSKWDYPHFFNGDLDYWFLGGPKIINQIKDIYSSLDKNFFKKRIFSNHIILRKYLLEKNIATRYVLKEHDDFKLTSRQYSKRTWYIKIVSYIVFVKEFINDRR